MDRTFEEMSDAELIAALSEISPLALNLSDLLVEMWKRGLREAEKYAADMMASSADVPPDRRPVGHLYDVLEMMCSCFDGIIDAKDWLPLATGYDSGILEALLINGSKRNPRVAFEVVALAANDADVRVMNTVLCCLARVVPVDDAELPVCLMKWADWPSLTPNTRLAIFERLAQLPWLQTLEDFFVQQCIDNKYDDPRIAAAISRALERPR